VVGAVLVEAKLFWFTIFKLCHLKCSSGFVLHSTVRTLTRRQHTNNIVLMEMNESHQLLHPCQPHKSHHLIFSTGPVDRICR
jgi:hypothetical protein